MSGRPLRAALAEYLAVRRSLGFKLARDGLLLEKFAGFCASRVTSELALAWVSAPAKASAGWLGMRLTVVRGFASWLQAGDPATEVPPLGWLPPRRRTTPYLYSADDVAAWPGASRGRQARRKATAPPATATPTCPPSWATLAPARPRPALSWARSYRRIARRRGSKRANVALGRSIPGDHLAPAV